ncbi:hypothetical protein OSTOST_03598 [Ostertagia ostertagi]
MLLTRSSMFNLAEKVLVFRILTSEQYHQAIENRREEIVMRFLSERESLSPAPRQSANPSPANDERYREMSMMQMARHMFKFDEVRNAIQDFDEELYYKIAT